MPSASWSLLSPRTHLRHPNHEKRIGLFVIIRRQTAEQLSQPRIVGSRTNKTHGQDGVLRDLEVRVVAVFREGVEDGKLRVRGGDEAEREGHGLADGRVAVGHLES